MAETLGSLCDKLTIVKLKQWHADEEGKRQSLITQEEQLKEEIDEFIAGALSGRIPPERLTFSANKIYKKEGNPVGEIKGDISTIIARLAEANCKLWHVQEHVYDFEKVSIEEKDGIVKQLALLNLERTRCIDQLDSAFRTALGSR